MARPAPSVVAAVMAGVIKRLVEPVRVGALQLLKCRLSLLEVAQVVPERRTAHDSILDQADTRRGTMAWRGRAAPRESELRVYVARARPRGLQLRVHRHRLRVLLRLHRDVCGEEAAHPVGGHVGGQRLRT